MQPGDIIITTIQTQVIEVNGDTITVEPIVVIPKEQAVLAEDPALDVIGTLRIHDNMRWIKVAPGVINAESPEIVWLCLANCQTGITSGEIRGSVVDGRIKGRPVT